MRPPRRTKRKQSGSLAEQVLSKRNRQTNIHESASENQSGSSSANVVISDSQLNSLADILLKIFQERGVVPCQMPAKLLMKVQNWLLFQLLNLFGYLFLPQFLSNRRKQ